MNKFTFCLALCAGLVVSCSSVQSTFFLNHLEKSVFSVNTEKDYWDYLSSLGELYINSPETKVVKMGTKNEEYLKKLHRLIVESNTLLFKKKENPRFFIINDYIPFYFSLPGGMYFFSLGLFKKYFKYETILLSVITYCILRSQLGPYHKKIITPTGYIRSENLISLFRLSVKDRNELNKWTYYAMKRSGNDPTVILNWIQQKNRNILDFALQVGDVKTISEEEFAFKNFIVKHGITRKMFERFKENSSSDFYRLIKDVTKIKYEKN